MSEDEKIEDEKEEETDFKVEDMLVEGCMSSKAKETISQLITRRMAEVDPGSLNATFLMKLHDEIGQMPTCKDLVAE